MAPAGILHISRNRQGKFFTVSSDGGGKKGRPLASPRGLIDKPTVSPGRPSFQGAEAQHTEWQPHSLRTFPCRRLGAKVSHWGPCLCHWAPSECASFAPPRCCYCLESKWPSRGKALEMKLFLLHAVQHNCLLSFLLPQAATSLAIPRELWSAKVAYSQASLEGLLWTSDPTHQSLCHWPNHHNSHHLSCICSVHDPVLSTWCVFFYFSSILT